MAVEVGTGSPRFGLLKRQLARLRAAEPAPSPLFVLAVIVVVFSLDVATGREVHFPILYAVPVAGAAWFGQRRLAWTAAIGLPVLRVLLERGLWFDGSPAVVATNAAVSGLTLGLLA